MPPLKNIFKNIRNGRTYKSVMINPIFFDTGEFVDCLLTHPDAIQNIVVDVLTLTDVDCAKLVQCVAISSKIDTLDLSYNKFEPKTYMSMAKALRVNSSLKKLCMFGYTPPDELGIDVTSIQITFIDALRLNSVRPIDSKWELFEILSDDFHHLKSIAEEMAPPNMLEFLLCIHSH